jgi:VanZ family protein
MPRWIHLSLQPQHRRHWAALFVATLLFTGWQAFKPVEAGPFLFTHADKLLHAAAFAMLMLQARLAWPGAAVPAALGLLAWGALIEVVQIGLPPHQADGWDLLADAAGIALGAVTALALHRLVLRARPD